MIDESFEDLDENMPDIDKKLMSNLFVVGALSGAMAWALSFALKHLLILPFFCQASSSFWICASGGNITWGLAHVLVAIISLFFLVKKGVFRPMMVVISIIIALWGLGAHLSLLTWPMFLLWQTVIFALAYAVFGWLASTKNFTVALISSLIVVVIVHFAIAF